MPTGTGQPGDHLRSGFGRPAVHGSRGEVRCVRERHWSRAGRRPRPRDTTRPSSGATLHALDVEVGDELTVSGSVKPGVRRVTIVGRYDAPRTLDDLLIRPLDSAADLATGPSRSLIRVKGPVSEIDDADGVAANQSGAVVTGLVRSLRRVATGDSAPSPIAVRNVGNERADREVTVRYQGDRRPRRGFPPGPERSGMSRDRAVSGFARPPAGSAESSSRRT